MWYDFRWIAWNLAKIDKHGLSAAEVEHVVNYARKPFPRIEAGRWFVAGPTQSGEWIQVVFLMEHDETVFVIHARPLDESERHRFQRMIRGKNR